MAARLHESTGRRMLGYSVWRDRTWRIVVFASPRIRKRGVMKRELDKMKSIGQRNAMRAPHKHAQLRGAALVMAISISIPFPAAAQTQLPPDLTNASLEDLLNAQVTSVSKKDQALFKAAAAVFVISRDDIRRSGAVNIPDLLRM